MVLHCQHPNSGLLCQAIHVYNSGEIALTLIGVGSMVLNMFPGDIAQAFSVIHRAFLRDTKQEYAALGLNGAVPRQVDSSNIKRSFSCCSPIRGELVTDFGSPQGLPFLIQELS